MTKQDIKDETLRKELGLRFKDFRESIKKQQDELAHELKVSQGTTANIESGKFYPKFKFLYYLYRQYYLDINWILTGKGEMIISPEEDSKAADITKLLSHIDENDPRARKPRPYLDKRIHEFFDCAISL